MSTTDKDPRVDGLLASARRTPSTRRIKNTLSALVGAAMFVLAIWVLHRWMSHVTLHQLGTELERISLRPVVLAILATALSFVALFGYELYAIWFIERRLALPIVALYSFITQSIAHSIGFAIFVGATIRYKLYAPRGFSLFEIAKVQVFFTTTFGLGALTLWSIVLLLEPTTLASTLGLPTAWLRSLGGVLMAIVLAFLIWGAWFHHPIRLGSQVIVLPRARITIVQILLGIADLCAVAAALKALMPADLGLGYAELLGVFVAATTLGLLSHIPGSLGVFESAVLVLIDPNEHQTVAVIGALVAFRAIYYMLPLLLGALAFGAVELQRWFRQRGAIGDAG